MGCALALLLASLAGFTPAIAQSEPSRYAFCYGLAGNPRGEHFTRAFKMGPSGSQPGFTNYLHKKYGGYVTQEIACQYYPSAAEALTERQKLIDEALKNPAWPVVHHDWIPPGATALSGPTPGAESAESAPKPPAPAAAAAPAATTGPKLDRWGRPIPTSAYWVCHSHLRKNLYVSAPFVANTLDRSPQEMFEQFLDYLNKRYHEGGTATCNKYATQAEAEQRIAQMAAEAPGTGYRYAKIDYVYAPGKSTSDQPVPAAAPKPAKVAAAAPKPAPAAGAAKSAAPQAAKPAAATASTPGVWVICRSEWNTDLRRFYNPPVDGRGAGYAEWQASYHAYLVSHHKFKGSNFGCGNYPTREAAQADFESWVVQARQQPTINGENSPIIITNWKY
jgi:hypothetical protein